MVEIIEHSDYNAPIDNQNVALLNFHNNGGYQEKKAFKIFEGIWIIPEIFDEKSQDPRIARPDKFWCYNPDYLKTDDERSDYLKKMTTIFKRIALNSFGGELLKYLKYSNSSLSGGAQMRYLRKVEKKDGRKISKLEEVDCTVIIHGSANLKTADCYSFYKMKEDKPNFGKSSLITFCPEITRSFNSLVKDSIVVQDPAVVLFHELTHAFHNAHCADGGVSINLSALGTNLEEVVTFGGIDLEESKAKLEKFSSDLLDYRRNIIVNLNKLITKKTLYKKHVGYLSIKYGLQIDKLGNLFTNKELDEKYIYTMFGHFTEVNFSDAFSLPKRPYYSIPVMGIALVIDVNNPEEYTVENGLAKSLLKRDSSETVTLHKNSYLPKDWQAKLLKRGSTFYQMNYINKKHPDLYKAIQKKEGIPNREELDKMMLNYKNLGIKVNIPSECASPGFKINN